MWSRKWISQSSLVCAHRSGKAFAFTGRPHRFVFRCYSDEKAPPNTAATNTATANNPLIEEAPGLVKRLAAEPVVQAPATNPVTTEKPIEVAKFIFNQSWNKIEKGA